MMLYKSSISVNTEQGTKTIPNYTKAKLKKMSNITGNVIYI